MKIRLMCILVILFVSIQTVYASSSDKDVKIIELSHDEYLKEKHVKTSYDWLFQPRAFFQVSDYGDYKEYKIYIDKEAFFLDRRDKEQLISHELGHVEGKEDKLIGTMSFTGVIRYFTGGVL